LTYDFLSGTHPMPPQSKTDKYYYQSVAVLRPVAG
jgi:hypothetical protein